MSYGELRSLGVVVRPLTDPKPPEGGRWSTFSAGLSSTIETLAAELRALGATNVVLELDLRERDIRLDGLPRADARPTHDGVALSFESKFGPLRYATAEFAGRWSQPAWQANLRAIALSMKALRAVDRYGVSKRGEQYAGWKALPAVGGLQSEADARAFLEAEGGLAVALRRYHPDTAESFDPEAWARVVRAKELVS